MTYRQHLLGSTLLVGPVFAALLPSVGPLASTAARAADDVNPAGVTLTSTVVLSSLLGPADRYINDGDIRVSSGEALIASGTAIGYVVNNGVISGNTFAVDLRDSNILSVDNAGTIVGNQALYLGRSGGTSTLDTLTNSGIVIGTSYGLGVDLGATVTSVVNTGTITSLSNAVILRGTIGTLDNSGMISSQTLAINSYSGGSIGVLNNSGTIEGRISSDVGLLINGASSGMGTLTGYGASGTLGSITIGSGDLTFGTGNLLLNDNVSVASHTVANTGANLYVSRPVTITGAYAQSAAASLNVNVAAGAVATGDVATDSGYGRLVVNGAATIASGSSINLKSRAYGFANGQRFVVIRAQEAGTDYNESALNYSAQGFTGAIAGSAATAGGTKDLVLSLSGPATHLATAPNAVSALDGLQSYRGTSSAELLNLYNASLAIGSTAEANKAGEQLAPGPTSASAGAAAATATFDMFDVIGHHLGSLRGGSLRGADAEEGRGMAAGEAALSRGIWGQAFGGVADQGTVDQTSGYRAYYGGFVTGIDRAIADNWRLGGALSYSRTSVDGQDNLSDNRTTVDSYGLTAYAGYTGADWYANLFVSGAQQTFSTRRVVDFTGFSDLVYGDFAGQQFATKAEVGYPIALAERLTLTPLAELSYSYSRQDGYTETSSNGAALKVDASDSYALRSGLGGKLSTMIATPFGDVAPYVQAIWLHQYNDERSSVTAQYAADPLGETSFTSHGSQPIRDMADLGLGATLLSSDDLSVTARYGVQLAPDYSSQTLSLRVRQLF